MQHTSSMPEEWRDIPGQSGFYQVSDRGRVRSVDRLVVSSNGLRRNLKGKVLKQRPDEHGRLQVVLRNQKDHRVHQLVMRAFVGPCPPGMVVCHSDGDNKNNRLENLRFDSRGNNSRDAVKHGTHYQGKKTHCPRKHPLEGKNLVPHLLRRGRRSCLACARTHSYVRTRPDLKDQFKEISDSYYLSVVSEN